MNIATVKNVIKRIDSHFLNQRLMTWLHPVRPTTLTHLLLDITDACNLNCQMCSLKEWHAGNIGQRMSLEFLQTLAPIIPHLHLINLQCNCEPLLHPELIQIITFIKNLNPQIFLSFVTNGTLLTPSLSAQLVDAQVDLIGFSIDAASRTRYESIRKGAHFDRVISNLRELIAIRNAKGASLPEIIIAAVIFKENLHEFAGILHLASQLGIKTVRVNGLEPYTIDMANQVLYGRIASADIETAFAKLRNLSEHLGITLKLPATFFHSYTSCQLTSAIIDAVGNVYPCALLSYERPYFYDGKQLMHPKITFGNLHRQSFNAIWNTPEYITFRSNLWQGKFPSYCQTCLLQNKVIYSE